MAQRPPLHDLRAIFFDLFNTLARFWPPREEVQSAACRDFGIQVTHQGIALGYARADAFMAQENAGPLPLRLRSPEARAAFFGEYERLILQGAGADVGLDLAGRVWERVRQIPYDMTLFDDVVPNLDLLRRRGLTLGLITNMNRDGRELTESLGLKGHVDFAVTSQEVGAEKPGAPIFLAALERAGVGAEQAAHVGDQVTSDVEGALGVGIRPVLMDRFATLSAGSEQAPSTGSPKSPESPRTGKALSTGSGQALDGVPVVRSMVELVALVNG